MELKKQFKKTKEVPLFSPVEVMPPETRYTTASKQIEEYVTRTFPDETDRFKFLEQCAISNAILAQGQFQRQHENLTAEGAARAFGIFADKALQIRKARESGFQEAPINVSILISLQETLARLTPTKNAQD